MAVQPGLCQTWLETPKTDFLTTRLKCFGQIVWKPLALSHRTDQPLAMIVHKSDICRSNPAEKFCFSHCIAGLTPGREVNTYIIKKCYDAILLSDYSHPHQYPTVQGPDMKEWINFKSSHLCKLASDYVPDIKV